MAFIAYILPLSLLHLPNSSSAQMKTCVHPNPSFAETQFCRLDRTDTKILSTFDGRKIVDVSWSHFWH